MLISFVLLVALAHGPQVVLSSFKLSFADVEQCGPVAITFSGDVPSANELPLTLTVMPFNSSPISIPIPNTAVTSSTVWATFFPLEEGNTFVAGLENVVGDSYGHTSDVYKIHPSSSNNSTCLPSRNSTARRFSVGPVSQCQPFDVTYNTTLVHRPPSIRALPPRRSAFAINETGAPALGIETYLMSASRQTEVVLLFDDGLGYREISDLLTVGGDSSSDDGCVLARKANSSPMEMDQKSSSSQSNLSKGAIIGVSVVAGLIVGAVAILMMVYISRERRRRRVLNFVNSRMVRPRASPANMLPPFAGRLVSRPPYASEKTFSAAISVPTYHPEENSRRLTDAVQRQSRPYSLAETTLQNYGENQAGSIRSVGTQSVGQHSLSSLDIEHILNMATIYSEPPPRPPPVATSSWIASPLLSLAPGTVSPRHLRDPSDVPVDPSPHQSISAFFPNGLDRISNGSYPAGQYLTVATQSGLLPYNTLSGEQARSTGLPPPIRVSATLPPPPPPRVSERTSSFPVSATSLSPPRQPWDTET